MSGARFLARFALWFPLGLTVVLGLGLPLLLTGTIHPAFWMLPVPWIVIGPMMGRSIRRNCERALGAVVKRAAG